jgi:hypothetical protein
LMDNCSVHMRELTLRNPPAHWIKVATFPPHTTNVFQCLDLSLFDILKKRINYKLLLDRDDSMAMFIQRIFTTSNTPWSKIMCIVHLSRLESGIISIPFPIASYSMNLHFAKARGSPHFATRVSSGAAIGQPSECTIWLGQPRDAWQLDRGKTLNLESEIELRFPFVSLCILAFIKMSLMFNGHMAIFFLSEVTEQSVPIYMRFEGEISEILAELLSGRSTGVGQIFYMGHFLCTTVLLTKWGLSRAHETLLGVEHNFVWLVAVRFLRMKLCPESSSIQQPLTMTVPGRWLHIVETVGWYDRKARSCRGDRWLIFVKFHADSDRNRGLVGDEW